MRGYRHVPGQDERGSFDVYEAALDDEAERFALIEDLRRAMADGSLELHYQPEVDLRTGRTVTVEAFLRWPHPTLGPIPPEHLLDLAEESGLIHPLTTWVFDQAIADCARWWREGHRVAVAVNLLATDLSGFGTAAANGGAPGRGRLGAGGPRSRDHRGDGHGRPDPIQTCHSILGGGGNHGVDR